MNVLYGILGAGGLAAIFYYIPQFLGKKSDIKKGVHDVIQKIGQKKIATIEKKQVIVAKKLEENEALTEETREKIKKIKTEANKKIMETLKAEDFEKLVQEENELW